MQGWHTTFLGMRGLPRDISDFEMKAFFTFDGAERDAINARRGDSHKLGLALHIGFLRMSGRLLGAFRVIPVADRKSTRLNSSHTVISYAVFCLKKKNKEEYVVDLVGADASWYKL